MKPGRVEKIIAVNKNGNPATMAEFSRRTCGRLELHCNVPQNFPGLTLRCSYKLFVGRVTDLIF